MKSLRESLVIEASDLKKKYDKYNKQFNTKPNRLVTTHIRPDEDPEDNWDWDFDDVPEEVFALANYLGSKAKKFEVCGFGDWGDGQCNIEIDYKNKEVVLNFEWGSEDPWVDFFVNDKNVFSPDADEYFKFQCPFDEKGAMDEGLYNIGMLVDMWKKYIE